VAKDPLAGEDVGVPRRRHVIPSVIAEESTIVLDVYARVCSCKQCWASKCRGL
jgi:hypothetical protein